MLYYGASPLTWFPMMSSRNTAQPSCRRPPAGLRRLSVGVRTALLWAAMASVLGLPVAAFAQAEVTQGEGEELSADPQAEMDLVGRVNAMRNVVGRRGLVRDPRLDEAAGGHAAELALTGRLSHASADGATPADRVARASVLASKVGENVARAETAAAAHEQWVQSEAHRENMLDGDFTHVGIAAVRLGHSGALVVVQLLVTMAALPVVEEPATPPTPPAETTAPEAASVPGVVAVPDAVPAPEVAEAPEALEASPAPADAPFVQAPEATPSFQVPAQSGRSVAGYWVHHFGTWYYYPLPADARPGQRLVPVAMPQGPPAALLQGGQGRVVYQGGTVVTVPQRVAPARPTIAPRYRVPRYQPR